MGSYFLIDAQLLIDGSLSVSTGHQILKESENWATELPKIPKLGFELVDQLKKYNQLEKEKIFELTELHKDLKYWVKANTVFYLLIILIFIALIIFLNYGS